MKRLFEYALVVIGVLCMGACQSEEYAETEPEAVREPGLYISLNASDNGGSLLSRGAMPDEEDYISSLSVFYFSGLGTGSDSDFKLVEQEDVIIASASSLAAEKEFKLKPDKAKDNLATDHFWRVAFVANVSTLTGITEGMTLAAFKNTIVVASANTTTVWTGTVLTNHIPMYHCTNNVKLPNYPYDNVYYINDASGGSITTKQTHKLIRMMAKFTLSNKKLIDEAAYITDKTLYNFEIKSVSLINGYKGGLVCYANSSWSSTEGRINSPTISNTDYKVSSCDLTVSNSYDGTTGLQTFTFYTFERDVSTGSNVNNITNNCYIKLTGIRTGYGLSPESNISYMLPIYKTTKSGATVSVDPNNPGPILRNHYYKYAITGVNLYSLRASLQVAPWIEVGITNADPIPLR